MTTHKAQGTTVNKDAYVLAGGALQDRELSYVQISRARESTHVYIDRLEAGDELAGICRQMNRSRQKQLAHDVLHHQEQSQSLTPYL